MEAGVVARPCVEGVSVLHLCTATKKYEIVLKPIVTIDMHIKALLYWFKALQCTSTEDLQQLCWNLIALT